VLFIRIIRILWDTMGYYGILWDTMGYYQVQDTHRPPSGPLVRCPPLPSFAGRFRPVHALLCCHHPSIPTAIRHPPSAIRHSPSPAAGPPRCRPSPALLPLPCTPTPRAATRSGQESLGVVCHRILHRTLACIIAVVCWCAAVCSAGVHCFRNKTKNQKNDTAKPRRSRSHYQKGECGGRRRSSIIDARATQ
jgi:hypothetical protein